MAISEMHHVAPVLQVKSSKMVKRLPVTPTS